MHDFYHPDLHHIVPLPLSSFVKISRAYSQSKADCMERTAAAIIETKSCLDVLMPKRGDDRKAIVLTMKDASNPCGTHFPLLCQLSGECFWYCSCVTNVLPTTYQFKAENHRNQKHVRCTSYQSRNKTANPQDEH